MKKALGRLGTFLLIFTLIVSTFTVPVSAAKKNFKDVTANKWYYSIVENLAGRGIINGYPDGTFKPDNKVERQHVCAMVMKGAGIKNSGKKANFPDVPNTSEFSTFIATMADKGIVNGFPDGTFRPKSPVTRGQAAIMIARAFGLKSAMHIEDFRDTVGHYAANHIRILNSHGVINGYPDGAFKPNAPVTRAEISKMISFAMTASAGSTKHRPDPKVQDAENLVRIAERSQTISTITSARDHVEDLSNDNTRQQLHTRLDNILGYRLVLEKESNNYQWQANVADDNCNGTVDYFLFGKIDFNYDMDWYRFRTNRSIDFTLIGAWRDWDYLGEYLGIYLANADGTPIVYSYTYSSTDGIYQVLDAQIPPGEFYLVVWSSDTMMTGDGYSVFVSINP